MFLLRINKHFYSTLPEPFLWVKYNTHQPVKISTENCLDLYDFTRSVKLEFDELKRIDTNEITAHIFTDFKNALSPENLLTELPNIGMTCENPILVA